MVSKPDTSVKRLEWAEIDNAQTDVPTDFKDTAKEFSSAIELKIEEVTDLGRAFFQGGDLTFFEKLETYVDVMAYQGFDPKLTYSIMILTHRKYMKAPGCSGDIDLGGDKKYSKTASVVEDQAMISNTTNPSTSELGTF